MRQRQLANSPSARNKIYLVFILWLYKYFVIANLNQSQNLT
ncbi:hypothetical protein HFN_0466 [Helicobacter fennelliae MRY12-0050]|uniref:Uncharacterized protein n=1 Tax=Helicobacter fennelliae MRY12-0050 TaxID=1325130 RepID=T1CZH1_9HELI|nr:hypothetical protein HFN_0466 [Helicobacter fennelliae MRY12-0050]